MQVVKFITARQTRHTCPQDHLNILALEKYKKAKDGVYVPAPDLKEYEAGRWPLISRNA